MASTAPAAARRASASAGPRAASAGSGDRVRPPRRSRLTTSGASGSAARRRRRASIPGSDSVPTITRATPRSSSAATAAGSVARVDHDPRLPGERGDQLAVALAAVIASRSAT